MSHPQIQTIFEAWGGNAEQLAADIGESGVTVRQWRRRNSIPPRYWNRIIDAAARRGKVVTLEQFLPATEQAA